MEKEDVNGFPGGRPSSFLLPFLYTHSNTTTEDTLDGQCEQGADGLSCVRTSGNMQRRWRKSAHGLRSNDKGVTEEGENLTSAPLQ